MAIYLITGTPGAGKTLNTIEAVHKRAEKESRAVYYANIEGVQFENWHKMEDHRDKDVDITTAVTPHSWFNAPAGSILLIDECQDFYPSMSANKMQPDYIMKYATHRHHGYDVYLITQGPNLINSKLKDWVTPHIHYRRIYGGKKTYRYTNEQVVNNIRDVNAISKAAIKQKVKLNPKYFGTYESAVVHTQNRRINIKLLLLIVVPIFAIPLGLWVAYSRFVGYQEPVMATDGVIVSEPQYGPLQQHSNGFLPSLSSASAFNNDKFDPTTAYQPRIATMPETAPAYDELRQPRDFPRPQCVYKPLLDDCSCYTQQATLMQDYPRDLCLSYVNNGYFDPTKLPNNESNQRNDINRPSDIQSRYPVPSDYSPSPVYHLTSDGRQVFN